MFLNKLKEDQKSLFLDLAIKATEANGVIESSEQEMLKMFAHEMKISPKFNTNKSLDSILNGLQELSTQQELKIISFEILGIMFSDDKYDEKEGEFISNMASAFHLENALMDIMSDLISEYSAVYKKICGIVLYNLN